MADNDISAGQQAAQEATATRENREQRKTVKEAIVDGFRAVKSGIGETVRGNVQNVDTREAAGLAVGGPFYEAAKEIQGAAQDIFDSPAWGWLRNRVGGGDEEQALPPGEAEAQRVPKPGRDEFGRYTNGKAPVKTTIGTRLSKAAPIQEQVEAPPPSTPLEHKTPFVPGRPRDSKGRFTRVNGTTVTPESAPVVKTLASNDKRQERRHKELLREVKGKRVGTATVRGALATNTPAETTHHEDGSIVKDGIRAYATRRILGTGALETAGGTVRAGGAMMRGATGGIARGVSAAVSAAVSPAGLTLMAGAAALIVVGSALKSLFTGMDNIVSKIAQKLGLAPKVETNKDGKITGTPDKKVVEQGEIKGLGALSAAYEGEVGTVAKDNKGWSYGKWQFNSGGQLPGFLADKKNPYGKELLTAGRVNSPGFQAKWKEIAARDPKGFEEAQREYITKANYQPAADYAGKAGFKIDDRMVKEAIFSGAVQHGGIKKVIDATSQTPGFADMNPSEQINAFYDAREQYVKTRAGLSPQETKQQMARYASERKKALFMQARLNGAPPPPAKPGEKTATAYTPAEVTAMREKFRADEEAPKIAYSNAIQQRPLVTPAQPTVYGTMVPRRMEPPTIEVPPPVPAQPASVQGMEQLISRLDMLTTLNPEKRTEPRPGPWNIKTEFDDTLLTLIAYDRI